MILDTDKRQLFWNECLLYDLPIISSKYLKDICSKATNINKKHISVIKDSHYLTEQHKFKKYYFSISGIEFRLNINYEIFVCTGTLDVSNEFIYDTCFNVIKTTFGIYLSSKPSDIKNYISTLQLNYRLKTII